MNFYLNFKRFLIDKIQDKNKVFQRQISNELKVKNKSKVKSKQC
jgi:hypothetical protein